MNKLTSFASVTLMLLLLTGLSVTSALAQDAYVDRNGTGTACTVEAPCNITEGISMASDTVRVRVRSKGATTVIDDDVAVGKNVNFAVYERSGSTAKASEGTIQFGGNVTITSGFGIAKKVVVHLAGDEVVVDMAGKVAGDTGTLMLGTNAGMQMLKFGEKGSCGKNNTTQSQFHNITVTGDVDVRCSSSSLTPQGLDITNSLTVNSGTLDLGSFDVTVSTMMPTSGKVQDAGMVTINSRVEGRGDFVLAPQEETAALSTGNAPAITIDTTASKIPPAPPAGVITVVATEDGGVFSGAQSADYPLNSKENDRTGQIIAAWPHLSVDAGDYKGAAAAADSLWYVWLNVTSGFANDPAGCFMVSGGGVLDMNLVKEMNSGACVTLASIGRGGISQNKGGALYVTSATQLNGKFIHGASDTTVAGDARTEFWKLARLTEDLEVFGGGKLSPGHVGPTNVDASAGFAACDAGGMTGRTTGVYFFSGVTVDGDVLVRNTNRSAKSCPGGVSFSGDGDPSKDDNGESGGSVVSTVKGVLELDASTVSLGKHNGHHSLVLEDDLYTTGGSSVVYAEAAKAGGNNVCGSYAAMRASGNRVILSGSVAQDIDVSGSLGLASVVVDKASGSMVSITNGNIVTGTLAEVVSGTLETNGKLDLAGAALVINQSSGSVGRVSRGDGSGTYVGGGPASVYYTGNRSQDTGDELVLQADGKAMVLADLEIHKAAGKELALLTDVQVTNLKLTSGYLVPQEASLTLVDNSMVSVGNGDIAYPADGDLRGKVEVPTKDKQMIDLAYVGKESRMTGMLWQAAGTESGAAAQRIEHVTIDSACKDGHPVISLGAGWSQLAGNLTINDGALDINGQHLVIFADKDNIDQQVTIGAKGYLCDSGAGVGCMKGSSANYFDTEVTDNVRAALADFREADYPSNREALRESLVNLRAARTAAAKNADSDVMSMVHFAGDGNTTVMAPTSKDRLSVALPYVIVKRDSDGKDAVGMVTFAAGGTPRTTSGGVPPNMVDEVSLLGYTQEHGNATVAASVDVLKTVKGFALKNNTFTLMPGVNSGAAMNGEPRQTLSVGMDYMQTGGSFVGDGDGDVMVYGNFMQAAMLDSMGMDPGIAASFDLAGGMHAVMGDFRVGASKKDMKNLYQLGAGEACVQEISNGDTTMACMALPAELSVAGDYHFAGMGDINDKANYTSEQMGLKGSVMFIGESDQMVWHGGPETQFQNVTVNTTGDGMVILASDGVQRMDGTLILKRGVIDSSDEMYQWMVQNDALEEDLVGRNTANPEKPGAILYGSRNSYVSGPLSRAVSKGNAGGGIVTGGYLFPVGEEAESDAGRQVANFRPLIMQLPDDLGGTNTVVVDYAEDMMLMDMQWPESGIVVDADGGGNLLLDAVADMFWKVEFENGIPAHDPNIRVVASGLSNVFDVRGLRLVQFDCDGSNARLAGVYDLAQGPADDKSFASNDFVNGVPNLTQEGVEVKECNIFGVASNFLSNPITLDPISGGLATVQFIHNVADVPAVDMYLDGNRVLDDWAFRSATGFVPVVHGDHTLEIVAPTAPDNSAPLYSQTITVEQHRSYNVIAHGVLTDFEIVTIPDVRMEAIGDNLVDFYVVHGAKNLGEVDIRLIDPIDNTRVLDLLANNIDFKDVGAYLSLAPGGYNLEVTTANNDRQIAVWRLELQQFRNQAFVLNLSGAGKSGAEGLGMLGVETSGDTFLPSEITATEESVDLPTEFVLEGNYPNPFNPATKIQFDLPETAQVRVEIIDMLGRSVMTVPAREIEAGYSRTIDVHAAELASGAYLYRMIAVSATDTQVKTGRMMLIK